MPLFKKQFIIPPNNETNEGFSHRNGSPVLSFTIPATDRLLETSSLNMIGKMFVYQSDDTLLASNGSADNFTNDGAQVNMHPDVAINIPNFGGYHSIIDKITVSSKKARTEIVNDDNYSQYTAITECHSYNEDDYKSYPLNKSLSTGFNGDKLIRRLLSVSNFAATKESSKGQNISLKLNIPLLNRYLLHLGEDFLGGLEIKIYLAPDNAVFSSRYRHINHNPNTNNQSGCYYTLRQVRLCGRYVTPTQKELKSYNPEKIVSDRVNLINDVHSSVNSNGYTPQLQFVRGVLNHFQRSDVNNNFKLQQNNFPQVVGLEKTIQSKNGLRFPYDYEMKVVPNLLNTNNNNLFKTSRVGDAEIRLHYQRSVLGGSKPYHTSATLLLTEENLRSEYEVSTANQNTGLNMYPDITGIGTDYSMGIGMTQNFINQDYSINLQSGVNTGNTLLPTDVRNKTLIQQTFVKNLQVVDTQKLLRIM